MNLENTAKYRRIHIALEAAGRKEKANKCVRCESMGRTAQNDDVESFKRNETASTGAAMSTFLALPAARF